MMTANKSAERKRRNPLQRGKHVPRKRGLRNNANMPKLARNYLARQPLAQGNLGVLHLANSPEARVEGEAGETANLDPAMSSPLHVQQLQEGNYTILRTRRSRTLFISRKEKAADPVRQMNFSSPSVSREDRNPLAEEEEDSPLEGIT
jgi:hypothetical protein